MTMKLDPDDVFRAVEKTARNTIFNELDGNNLRSNISSLVQADSDINFCNVSLKLHDLVLGKIKENILSNTPLKQALIDGKKNIEKIVEGYSSEVTQAIYPKTDEIQKIFSKVQTDELSQPKKEVQSWSFSWLISQAYDLWGSKIT